MRSRRLLFVAAAMGGGVLCAILVLGAQVPRAAIVAAAERALDHPLSVDRVRVRFVPQPSLELVNVRAPDAGVVAGGMAAFEAERVRLRLALGPLLSGRAVVERVDLDAPLLRIVRPVEQPAAPPRSRSAGPHGSTGALEQHTSRPQGRFDGGPAVFRLRRVEIRSGRLQYFDEATASRWAVGQAGVSVGLVVDPGGSADRASVVMRGVLRHEGRNPLTTFEVRGWLGWADRRPHFRGQIASGPFRYGPLFVDGGEGWLSADARGFHLRDLVLRVGGGAVAGRARVLLGAVPTVAFSVAGRGEALEDALDETRVVVRGDWQTRLRLEGALPGRSGGRRAMRGAGRVVIRDGAIEPFELGAAVLDVLAPLRGREQTQQLRDRYPELFAARHLRFQRLAGTFRLEGRRVRTRDLTLRGDAYRAEGRGTVSVDGRLALGLRLAISPALTEDLLGRRGLAAIVGAVPGQGLVLPLRLDGTIARPRIRTTQQWSRAVMRRSFGGSGMGDLLERLLR